MHVNISNKNFLDNNSVGSITCQKLINLITNYKLHSLHIHVIKLHDT